MKGVYIQSKTPHTHFQSGIPEALFDKILCALQFSQTSGDDDVVPLALRLMPKLEEVRESDSTDFYCHYGVQRLRFSCLTESLTGSTPASATTPVRVIEKVSRETWEFACLSAPYDARFQISLETPQPNRRAEDYVPDSASDIQRRKERHSFVYPAVQIDLTKVTDRRQRSNDVTCTYEVEVEIRAERVSALAAAVRRMSEYVTSPQVVAAETALHRAGDKEARRQATLELAEAIRADEAMRQHVLDTQLLYDTADQVHGAVQALLAAVGDDPLFHLK